MAKAALDRLAGPIQVQLGLKQTCHTLHRGREVNYTSPTLALVGAVLHVRSGPRGDVTSASDSATPGQLAEPDDVELLDRDGVGGGGLVGLEPAT